MKKPRTSIEEKIARLSEEVPAYSDFVKACSAIEAELKNPSPEKTPLQVIGVNDGDFPFFMIALRKNEWIVRNASVIIFGEQDHWQFGIIRSQDANFWKSPCALQHLESAHVETQTVERYTAEFLKTHFLKASTGANVKKTLSS